MQRILMVLLAVFLGISSKAAAVTTIPESDHAALAMAVIDAYHGPRPSDPPKKLHLVYFTPSDRYPAAQYERRVEAILEDIRSFTATT